MPEFGGKNFTLRDDLDWPFNDIPEPQVFRRDDCIYAYCQEAHLALSLKSPVYIDINIDGSTFKEYVSKSEDGVPITFCNRADPGKIKIYDRNNCSVWKT